MFLLVYSSLGWGRLNIDNRRLGFWLYRSLVVVKEEKWMNDNVFK